MQRILYLDLDGVLADFDEHANKLLKRAGRNAVTESEFYEILKMDENFFFNLNPTRYAYSIWAAANIVCNDVQILTALPARATFNNAMADKKRWVAKHFGANVKVNFGPYSTDKWKHARPNDVLVDDRPSNIQEWRQLGKAIAIHHRPNNPKRTVELLQDLS